MQCFSTKRIFPPELQGDFGEAMFDEHLEHPEEDDHPVLIPALRTGRVMGLNRLNVRMFALPPPITHEPWSFTLSGRSGVGSWAVRATWWGVACLGVMFKRQSIPSY